MRSRSLHPRSRCLSACLPLAFLIAFCGATLAGCVSAPETIRDIQTLPQSTASYLDPSSSGRELVTSERQQSLEAEYKARFLAPWHRQRPEHEKSEMEREVQKFRDEPGYGENKRKHDSAWLDGLLSNAALESYPNTLKRAITVADSDLRILPTSRPQFSSLDKAGSDYPFDNLQNSLAPANTPILVTHVSRDKSRIFVESHTGCGWIPAENAAWIDSSVADAWERLPHVSLVRDDVPVTNENGMYLFKAYMGSHFPLIGETADAFRVLAATADENRNARIVHACVPKNSSIPRPMKLTPAAVAAAADQLIARPYGWGGLYRNRDCSAMLQDLFAPFGLWMPRQSSAQAQEAGRFISLAGLSPSEKERRIATDGVPFFTLLSAKGHIMLYIGCHEGRPLVFHNFWGIRTKNLWGKEGRHVVGHAAVTTLHPGSELTDRDAASDLLLRIVGMTLLGQR